MMNISFTITKRLFISLTLSIMFISQTFVSAQNIQTEDKQTGIPVRENLSIDHALGKNPDAIVFSGQTKKRTSVQAVGQKKESNKETTPAALFSGVDKDTLTYYQIGLASWYGQRFQGRKTASGEPFDMYKYSAAHRTLPFGTRLLVRNLTNGKEVTVVINDRGPFIQNRILDLSYAAAVALGFENQGVVKVGAIIIEAGQDIRKNVANANQNRQVRLNLTDPDNQADRSPQSTEQNNTTDSIQKDPFIIWENHGKPHFQGQKNASSLQLDNSDNSPKIQNGFTFENKDNEQFTGPNLQIGSFKVQDNAERLKKQFAQDYQHPVKIERDGEWYKVRVYGFSDSTKARSFQKQLRKKGMESVFLKN